MQSFLDRACTMSMAISFRGHDRVSAVNYTTRMAAAGAAWPEEHVLKRVDLPIDAIIGKQDTHADEMGGRIAPKVMVLR
jgi:hypothetical protein